MLDTPSNTEPRSHFDRVLYQRDCIAVECALDELEGRAIGLRIIRHGYDTFTDMEYGSPGYMSALLAQVEAVLKSVGRLSEAYRGEPLVGLCRAKGAADAAEGDTGGAAADPDDTGDGEQVTKATSRSIAIAMTNPTVPAKLMELIDLVTDESIAKLCSDERGYLAELCAKLHGRLWLGDTKPPLRNGHQPA